MKLTKLQQSYLSEYMWDVYQDNEIINGCGAGENTCWLNINKTENNEMFEHTMKLLGRDTEVTDNVKVLIIASQIDK